MNLQYLFSLSDPQLWPHPFSLFLPMPSGWSSRHVIQMLWVLPFRHSLRRAASCRQQPVVQANDFSLERIDAEKHTTLTASNGSKVSDDKLSSGFLLELHALTHIHELFHLLLVHLAQGVNYSSRLRNLPWGPQKETLSFMTWRPQLVGSFLRWVVAFDSVCDDLTTP